MDYNRGFKKNIVQLEYLTDPFNEPPISLRLVGAVGADVSGSSSYSQW